MGCFYDDVALDLLDTGISYKYMYLLSKYMYVLHFIHFTLFFFLYIAQPQPPASHVTHSTFYIRNDDNNNNNNNNNNTSTYNTK